MWATLTNLDSQLGPAGGGEVGEELAVDGVVVSPTLPAAGKATRFLVSVKTKAALATFDGTAPASAGAGIYLPVTSAPMVWSRRMVAAVKLIEAVNGENGVVRFEPMAEG